MKSKESKILFDIEKVFNTKAEYVKVGTKAYNDYMRIARHLISYNYYESLYKVYKNPSCKKIEHYEHYRSKYYILRELVKKYSVTRFGITACNTRNFTMSMVFQLKNIHYLIIVTKDESKIYALINEEVNE